ncbi:hypothetical protein [Luteococcus japonicus]|uniref:Uncharacterized protein n=1 Tax=Luteococcus japonicus LSP_Lj1 TaxID=1255658 RepID=A0A1R4IQ59_9ACTN|nr:hypothetical protein [Luteococcus japonicus]SJN21373.1 hypothetical protein FM114_02780 [Luteococcus japonicus LSP_Lj1]
MHVSAGFTASVHEFFTVGHDTLGVGGADNDTQYSFADDQPPVSIESLPRARNQAWSLSASLVPGTHEAVVPAAWYPVPHNTDPYPEVADGNRWNSTFTTLPSASDGTCVDKAGSP